MAEERKNTAARTIALLATILAVAALIPTYHVSSNSSVRMVCNSQECFIFVSEWHLGWTGNYVVDAGRILKAFFYASSAPTHRNTSARGRLGETHAAPWQTGLFFHITSKEARRLWGPEVGMIGLHRDTMYVGGIGTGTWWKWSGIQLETVDAAERQRFEAATDRQFGPQVADYDGWSMHILEVNRDTPLRRDFHVKLAGENITISAVRPSEEEKRIEIKRGVGEAETIWSLTEGPLSVDRATYGKTLGLQWW